METATTAAAPVMGTAISRSVALGLVAVLLGGCGADHTVSSTRRSPATATASPGGLAFLPAQSAPATWLKASIPVGATLYYPQGWQTVGGDRGTATAVLRDAEHHITGYLNVTPRQGQETLADWASFRPRHNGEEGERFVRREATARDVRFRDGKGTCVRDTYTTTSATTYTEIACLVRGRRATSAIIAAAESRTWTEVSPLLYRAIAAFRT